METDQEEALAKANAAISWIELTHGCHRACVVGRVPRWAAIRFHRHAGPHCVPVRCWSRSSPLRSRSN